MADRRRGSTRPSAERTRIQSAARRFTTRAGFGPAAQGIRRRLHSKAPRSESVPARLRDVANARDSEGQNRGLARPRDGRLVPDSWGTPATEERRGAAAAPGSRPRDPRLSTPPRSEGIRLVDRGPHEGKHLPKARSNRGDPLMRIFLRSRAQTRLRSFARKPSHVRLSAVTAIPASPR